MFDLCSNYKIKNIKQTYSENSKLKNIFIEVDLFVSKNVFHLQSFCYPYKVLIQQIFITFADFLLLVSLLNFLIKYLHNFLEDVILNY